MKKLTTILFCTLVLTLCSGGAAYAQGDMGLPDPGITPDSPFYFADKWAKQLSLMFTFREEAKVEKALRYAEERLAEMNAMVVKNKTRDTTQAANEYNNYLAIATQYMERARKKGADTSEMVTLGVSKHIAFLNERITDVGENEQRVMTEARERAKVCQETAVRTMAQGDPEKAIRTNLMLMEQQLNRIRVRSEVQQATGLQLELQDFERLNNLGQEISQIAEGLGKGTTVDQLIAQATANHLAVLAEVHERAQVQAQGAVENAMRVCVENHERIVTRLQERNMLGEISEEPPIPEGIPESLRNRISSGGSGKGR